jgi:peptidoglycan/xylan/chitin deacetylase (PgdA/CDA1 family)
MKPAFVMSLDTELVWGSFDHTSAAEFERTYPDLRGTIRRLLALFEELEVPTTWAVVGHLFLGSCQRGPDGRAHPELPRPKHAWYPRDWYADDPCTDRGRDPLWYGDDVIDAIRTARAGHEIGCHSFSHAVFGDPGCTSEVAEAELMQCVRLAKERGLKLQSFVFPRNVEGHHALLRRFGFTAYRGDEPNWYRVLPGQARRAAHLLDQAAAIPPPVSTPVETLRGLWNIPGSMLLLHRGGVRRAVPYAARVWKAKLGLERAVLERKTFHLWFHPFNLCVDRDGMLGALREIVLYAVRLRDRGMLEIHTMGSLAAEAARALTVPLGSPSIAPWRASSRSATPNST